MFTRCFERDENLGYEVINISEYSFEWYIDNKLVRTGLVDGLDDTIAMLKNEGFEEVA